MLAVRSDAGEVQVGTSEEEGEEGDGGVGSNFSGSGTGLALGVSCEADMTPVAETQASVGWLKHRP